MLECPECDTADRSTNNGAVNTGQELSVLLNLMYGTLNFYLPYLKACRVLEYAIDTR